MRNIVVTGADGNLGNAVVPVLLAAGYHITATVMEMGKPNGLPSHPNLVTGQIDLTNEEETDAFVIRTIENEGSLYAGILLAGGYAMGNISNTKTEDIRKQVSLNFETAYNVARPLFNHFMDQRKGRLILMGARPPLKATDGKNVLAYALSKSLLFQLAECLNEEARGEDVSVTVIAPSTLDTPANRKSMPGADPNKWVNTTELANIMAFILSDNGKALKETVLKVYNNS